jgi:hypothetical protein
LTLAEEDDEVTGIGAAVITGLSALRNGLIAAKCDPFEALRFQDGGEAIAEGFGAGDGVRRVVEAIVVD